MAREAIVEMSGGYNDMLAALDAYHGANPRQINSQIAEALGEEPAPRNDPYVRMEKLAFEKEYGGQGAEELRKQLEAD
jgi:hypothetical protein